MQSFDIVKEVKPKKSFRVSSVIGKFDLQSEKITEHFTGGFDLSKEWQIGVIFGHSGTGKTTIAKELFKDSYIKGFDYRAETILDDMPESESVESITKMFNSVGFASPPSWLKPYSVLSTGEKMRVDLARAILECKELIVFDEFTSVVDRVVAKIGSYAISKAIRRSNKKFIAISCHEDIIEWLEPDWTFNTNDMSFKYTRGLLRRPQIELAIFEDKEKSSWELFRKYHYLNTNINMTARQFVAFYNEIPVAFIAVMHFPHPATKKFKRATRLVVLPDCQGVGIGHRMSSFVAEYFVRMGYRFIVTSANNVLAIQRKKSKNWKLKRFGRVSGEHEKQTCNVNKKTVSSKRLTTSWEYVL